MRRIIEQLKQQREKAKDTFIKNSFIERNRCTVGPCPNTDDYLDAIAELNQAISILENATMVKEQTKTKKMRKASEIYVRIGFEDITVPIADREAVIEEVTPQYFIGYEDLDGEECEEDGTYLNQNKDEEL